MTESHSVSLKEVNYLFPLWLYYDNSTLPDVSERQPNFKPPFLKRLANRLGLPRELKSGLPVGVMPEDIFHYAYSVFHSPSDRSRYAEYLKLDFPRLPLTTKYELFQALAKIGSDLVSLHLMESSKLDKRITSLIGSGEFRVEKVSFSDETVFIDRAKTRGFKGVSGDVLELPYW